MVWDVHRQLEGRPLKATARPAEAKHRDRGVKGTDPAPRAGSAGLDDDSGKRAGEHAMPGASAASGGAGDEEAALAAPEAGASAGARFGQTQGTTAGVVPQGARVVSDDAGSDS